MISCMTTRSRRQQRYDHRLRELVQRTGNVAIATALGVPRSTARGWVVAGANVVVSLEGDDRTAQDLRQEILKLWRRVEKLAALLRLALALVRASGFSLSTARLPEGEAKLRILSAIDHARDCLTLRAVLRFLHLSPSRFHTWRRRQTACALDDQLSCPRTSPHRLTPSEVQSIGAMVLAPEYRHGPDRDARRPRATARPPVIVAIDLIPPRPEVRMATPSGACAPSEAEGGAPHDQT